MLTIVNKRVCYKMTHNIVLQNGLQNFAQNDVVLMDRNFVSGIVS